MDNFNYIIGDEETKEAAIVDPAFEEGKVIKEAEENGYTVKHILLTHTHFDHIEGLQRALGIVDAVVYVHPTEKDAVDAPTITEVKEGDVVSIGKLSVKVHHTPGHTPGGVTYEVEKKLITGDALFVEACGRVDLPGGVGSVLFETLQKLATFPDDYEVYPGHDYGPTPYSTIKHEKEHNQFMKESGKQLLG